MTISLYMAPSSTERELKLGVWPGFELPALDGAIDGAAADETKTRKLEAVYFDTPDLRLLRRGVTLRFRRGESPPELWTAMLPVEAGELALTRQEVSLKGGRGNVPSDLADLVRGWALGAPLAPVARLRTVRQRTTIHDPKGRPLASIDDDEVSILRGSRVAARFRELDVELADGAPPRLLRKLAEWLQASGAEPVDQLPKLVRALGPPALEPWDLARAAPGRRPAAGELVQADLVDAAARLVDHLAAVVLDDDVEGVHQARVGIRRLRSDLRTFAPLLDRTMTGPVRKELGWLADELGEVRDLDVLLKRLRKDARVLDPADQPPVEEVLEALRGERADAYRRVRASLRSPRCAELLESVTRSATAPAFSSKRARCPAADVVPGLVGHPLADLRRAAKRMGTAPDDAALHRVRIHVKRLRYATELAAPLAGGQARGAARSLARLQDVLGDHNDACVAVVRLRGVSEHSPPAAAWAAGAMGGLQVARARTCRERFPAAWSDAVRAKRWRWVS